MTRESPVLELVTFRLAADLSPDAFVALAQATEPVLRRQPGYISRRLVHAPDGLEPLVGLAVDAGDEEARDGENGRRIASAGNEALEAEHGALTEAELSAAHRRVAAQVGATSARPKKGSA